MSIPSTDYDWYEVMDRQEFLDMDLPSYSFEAILNGPGLKTLMLMRGNKVNLVYDDIFLTAFLNEQNPFYFDDHAIFVAESNMIYLGILREE